MYFEKAQVLYFALLVLAAGTFALVFLYIKAKLDCRDRDRQIASQKKELDARAIQLEKLEALYDHTLSYDKSKTDFFTGVTHELKTPISVILGAAQLISLKISKGPEADPQLVRNLKNIRSNCFSLLRLINNLLDFSRADAGFYRFCPVNTNIPAVTEEILQSVMPFAQQKHLSVDFETENREIITAADNEKLERILLNLLSNAIKFTPAGGKIKVFVYTGGNKVCISVKDTGPGIPKEKHREVFEKFLQVNSNLISQQEGSGIGLWLVKSFVGLHGGEIRLVSDSGKGSEFIVELPLKLLDSSDDKAFQGLHHESLVQAADMEFAAIFNKATT